MKRRDGISEPTRPALLIQYSLHERSDALDRLAPFRDEPRIMVPDVRHARPFFEFHFAAGLMQLSGFGVLVANHQSAIEGHRPVDVSLVGGRSGRV